MLKRVKLSSLRPNPWRHFETYKLVPKKIESLSESIGQTGFWSGQITGRVAKPSGYEIAWGHHRWKAATEVLGENAYIEIIVEDLTDDDMLMRMARENNEVYDANASMDIEVIKAALEGTVQGRIHLPKNEGANKQMKVVDYVEVPIGSSATNRTFSREALVKHLGMDLWRVKTALGNLKLIHEEYIDEEDYDGLSPRQSQEVATQTRKAKVATPTKAAAKKVAKKVAGTMRKASEGKAKNAPDRGGYRQAASIAAKEISKAKGENQMVKSLVRKVDGTAAAITTGVNKLYELNKELQAHNITQLQGPEVRNLRKAMERMKDTLIGFEAQYPTKPQLKAIK